MQDFLTRADLVKIAREKLGTDTRNWKHAEAVDEMKRLGIQPKLAKQVILEAVGDILNERSKGVYETLLSKLDKEKIAKPVGGLTIRYEEEPGRTTTSTHFHIKGKGRRFGKLDFLVGVMVDLVGGKPAVYDVVGTGKNGSWVSIEEAEEIVAGI
mgnify:CR=1 FL=1